MQSLLKKQNRGIDTTNRGNGDFYFDAQQQKYLIALADGAALPANKEQKEVALQLRAFTKVAKELGIMEFLPSAPPIHLMQRQANDTHYPVHVASPDDISLQDVNEAKKVSRVTAIINAAKEEILQKKIEWR